MARSEAVLGGKIHKGKVGVSDSSPPFDKAPVKKRGISSSEQKHTLCFDLLPLKVYLFQVDRTVFMPCTNYLFIYITVQFCGSVI